MKLTKLVGMLLVAAMVIVSAACSGGSAAPTATKAAPTATTTTQQQPAATATKAPSGPAASAGGQFHGIPVPSSATQAQAMTWQMPGQATEDYENMEWRAYQTGQSLDNLKSFYKSEMSKQGWTQTMWMEGSGQQGEMAWGLFSKGDQDEMAWVYVVPEQDDFNLVLMWAGKEK